MFKLYNKIYEFLCLIQVLHGCRQSVSSEVRLTPQTDEIPFVNLNLTFHGSDRVPFGAKTSHYGPYALGYSTCHKNFYKVTQLLPKLNLNLLDLLF